MPDVVECEHAFSHLLCVTSSPELLQLLDYLSVVVWLDFCSVFAHSTFIICDDGSQTEHESLWEFSLSFEVNLHSWQVACLILRE